MTESKKGHNFAIQGPTEKKKNMCSLIFSSPEHKVLKVSYCDHPVSGVRRQSSVVRRVSSTIHLKHISS